MSGITPTDDLLDRAFNLAYFILGDRTASIYLAMVAMDKLKLASINQGKRFYYLPTGRSNYQATRTKVSLSHAHLLQRLIYSESEPFERLIEGQEGSLQQHEMIIRFIKHLVRVTTKHNSFYVALGMCRLLHNYTTSETMEIYNLIIQDPDRGRDDYYYRSRKKHLLRELKERFGNLLKTERGYRGEERFRPVENSGRYAGLVRECLLRFMPWGTPCVLPADVDPNKSILPPLQFNGDAPDQEHEIELNRIHTLLHPSCLERLTAALKLDPPARRLEIPHFFVSGVGDGPTDDRLKHQTLTKGETEAMRRYLEKNAACRKATSRKLLSILVDGDERARLEAGRINSAHINVEDDSEFIEVLSVEADEAVLLSIHPLNFNGGRINSSKATVMLGDGQSLSFAVQPLNGSTDERAGAIVRVDYHEAGTAKLISSLLRKLASPISQTTNPGQTSRLSPLRLAFGLLIVAICITGWLLYLYKRSAHPEPQLVAEQRGQVREGENGGQPSMPLPAPQPPRAPAAATSSPGRKNQEPPSSSPKTAPRNSGSTEEVEVTRGRTSAPTSSTLSAVKRVYIDALGENLMSRQVREMLIKSLESSGRFVVVESRTEADAVFKGSARQIGARDDLSVAIRLVNAKGQVIWSTAAGRHEKSYSGPSSEVADKVVKDLLDDIRRLEGGP